MKEFSGGNSNRKIINMQNHAHYTTHVRMSSKLLITNKLSFEKEDGNFIDGTSFVHNHR